MIHKTTLNPYEYFGTKAVDAEHIEDDGFIERLLDPNNRYASLIRTGIGAISMTGAILLSIGVPVAMDYLYSNGHNLKKLMEMF